MARSEYPSKGRPGGKQGKTEAQQYWLPRANTTFHGIMKVILTCNGIMWTPIGFSSCVSTVLPFAAQERSLGATKSSILYLQLSVAETPHSLNPHNHCLYWNSDITIKALCVAYPAVSLQGIWSCRNYLTSQDCHGALMQTSMTP